MELTKIEETELALKVIEKEDLAYLKVEELDANIALNDSNVEDIERLFNSIFDYVIGHEKLPVFKLESYGGNLYHVLANDLVEFLNTEIRASEQEFTEILKYKGKS
ncbi:hypothetical protein [Alkalibacillus salilacus]|uniref:Uncharacterized protein n=1 Tax=Alkalibacillus salilacus TaxID=284582 RepID=A0ABT9VIU8_9BACI|nr:hypothetical protein [Alkalibacillus salilacus]MDQ0160878.1 hypothetical protein [Alkalibacillus salilacus]